MIFFLVTSSVFAGEDPSWWYNQAEVLYKQGDFKRSLALLEAIDKRFSQNKSLLIKADLLQGRIYLEQNKYDKAIKVLQPWAAQKELPAEGLLILAQAYQAKELYDEALTYANMLLKRFPNSHWACQAWLILENVYFQRKLAFKVRKIGTKILKASCPLSIKAQALSFLVKAGEPIEKLQDFLSKYPQVKSQAPDLLKYLALYHLKKMELKTAEQEIFSYLNYSGDAKEAPDLLFQLAEKYFQNKRYREARRIYELIFTSWPYTKVGSFSKFRLYYMRYLFEEKIGHKDPHTRRLLIAICRRLKQDYPKEPITEEAQALEIKLLFEDHKIEDTLTSIWNFLISYPRSSYLEEIYGILCRSAALEDQKFLTQKRYMELISFHLSHKQALQKAGCGLHYYRVGLAYKALNLDGQALLYFLQAKEIGVPSLWKTDLCLDLASLLIDRKDEEDILLAQKILEELAKISKDNLKLPYYQFLLGKILLEQKRYAQAVKVFKFAFLNTGDLELKNQAYNLYLESLLRLGRLDILFSLLKKDRHIRPDLAEDLLLSSIKQDRLDLALKVIDFLWNKGLKDDEVLWLKALVYERLGEAEKAQEVWKILSRKHSLYADLALKVIKERDLLEKARGEIY